MQKTRPRRTGSQPASGEGTAVAPAAGKGRPTHVRNRLVVAVAVVAAAIAGAGAPSVLAASSQLKDSQDLVTLAGQTQDALALAHSLADERDEVTSYIAAGRPKSKAPSEQRSARVDRQVDDLRADTDTPAALRADLDDIASVRRSALTGQSSALQAHEAYSAAITKLHALAEQLAEQMPPRAGSGAYALAELDTAVQQAAAARGLLLAALNVPTTEQTVINPVSGLATTETTSSAADTKTRDALTAAAQQARLRSDAALADFRDTAPKAARTSYDSTVTGPEVNSADKYLASLTDQPTLSDSELGTSTSKVDAALSARVDAMRGVESALYDRRTKDLARLRDDDVSALELRIAVLGALLLIAVGTATAMARSLTRPLAVLRLGSARLAGAEDVTTEEPVKFTGRNDEFAQVVRSVNALHAHAVALQERIATLEADRKHLVGQRQKMADAREELRAEIAESAAQLERLRTSIGSTFVNLALRTLGLVERQLTVIEGMEEREQDPDRLATLFKLDHFATVMRRHSENLLVLAGTEHVQQSAGPVPLVDVVRAAVSEIERYERVRIAALPPHGHVVGFAADDLSHLLAELMENATSFSPPDLPVEVSGWLLENGEVMLSVQDEGIGMTGERMSRLNARLAEFDPESPYDQEGDDGLGLGLYVVARLAHRHGVRVQLREQKQGGVAAVVVLPSTLLAAAPTAAVPSATPYSQAHTYSLPGADAEANSNLLPTRPKSSDPLVDLAERAVREREETGEDTPARQPTEPAPEPLGSDPGPTAAAAAGERTKPEGAAREPQEPQRSAGERDGRDGAVPGSPESEGVVRQRPGSGHSGWEPGEQDAGEGARERAGVGLSAAETTMELFIPAQTAEEAPTHTQPGTAQGADASTHAQSGTAHGAEAASTHTHPGAAQGADASTRARPGAVQGADAPTPTQPAVAGGGDGPVGPPAGERESRTGGAGGHEPAEGEAEARSEHTRTPDEEPVTAKGLPKRTPKITAPAQTPRQRPSSVDAEALRRRLGGFRQGAQAGYRDVQAEIAEQTGQTRTPATGGTVEEASS
ncbi:sensor histidine kinase [Streptomyces sp. 7R007]